LTCIAALVDGKTVWMAADSMCTAGYDKFPMKGGKLISYGEVVLGWSGHARVGNILKRKFTAPEPGGYDDVAGYIEGKFIDALRQCLKENGHAQDWHGRESNSGELLVACQGKIFCVGGDYYCSEIATPYYAVGCGANYAIGALAQFHRSGRKPRPKDWLTAAIEISAEWSSGVGGDIDIVKL
jgi:ATP-dependent protease HslVU (ClpYQ) peptidase subunit